MKEYQIQYGSNWFNDYLIYREWPDGSYTLTNRDGKIINDLALVEDIQEHYINN